MDILIAFFIDCILGDPYWFPHPVRFIGKYINFFEKAVLYKPKEAKQLKYLYGPLLTITTTTITFLVTFLILNLAKNINIYLFYTLNIIILWTSIAPKCLSYEGYRIYKLLNENNIESARKNISYIVSRDTQQLDTIGISRATIETIFENTSDGVIAPLFFGLIGGAPLAMAYKAINTLDSMVGYTNEKYENFGFFSAKVDDFANFIPSRISAILIIISSFILRYNYKGAFKIFKRDRKNHKSPNSACPESAGAGALDIQLGGPTSYFGKMYDKLYIGDYINPIKPKDILKSIYILYTCVILWVIIYIIIYYITF